jgi:hypothetical protein
MVASTEAAHAKEMAYLGVLLGPVPEVLSAYGMKEGALIRDVVPASPAAKAGLRRNDIIVSAGGVTVPGPAEVTKTVQAATPGEVMSFELKRGTEPIKIDLTLGSAPAAPWRRHDATQTDAVREDEGPQDDGPAEKAFLGVGYTAVPPLLAYHLGLEPHTGIVVGDVWKDSPAEAAGLRRNDVLVSIGDKVISDKDDLVRLLAEQKAGDKIKVGLIQKGSKIAVDVTLAARPKELSLGSEPQSWQPGIFQGGTLSFKGPNDHEFTYKFPKGAWDLDHIIQDFDAKMRSFEGWHDTGFDYDQLSKNLRGFIEGHFQPHSAEESWPPHEGSRSNVRIRDGDYDITVLDDNGVRTVTVRKGDEVLAENLPYTQIDSLPKEVRERVEKVAGQLKTGPEPLRSIPTRGGTRV